MNNKVFAFEGSEAIRLDLMPFTVRMKLDTCHIKISLKQWQSLAISDRRVLVSMPCGSNAEVQPYTDQLTKMLAAISESKVQSVPHAPLLPSEDQLPAPVRNQVGKAGGHINDNAWSKLTDLERYALVKLSRDERHVETLALALHELNLE